MQLRKRIVKGEDFGKVAAEASEDPSAKDRDANGRKIKGNYGDLAISQLSIWFTLRSSRV